VEMFELNLKELEKDKKEIEQATVNLKEQLTQQQIQLYRLDGALGYINDNIKKIKEVEE